MSLVALCVWVYLVACLHSTSCVETHCVQLTPILTESITVQQYLEAETQRQVQSIKVTVLRQHQHQLSVKYAPVASVFVCFAMAVFAHQINHKY